MRQMKDSGIEWIGDIPQNWKTIKIKYTSWLKGRIGWQGLTASEYIDEGPFLVTGTDFQNGLVNWSSCAHISKERFDEDSDIHIKEGDLLITKDGTVGKVAIAKNCPDEVSLNSGVLLIRNVGNYKYYDKYLYYVLFSDEFWRWYTLSQTGQSTIKHLYQAQFYSFEYTYPSYEEQVFIANFLDTECSRIDAVIEQTRISIEEYKKLKQAFITQAVTKGIHPERQVKDSGYFFLGNISSDTSVVRLKNIVEISDGTHDTPEYVDPSDETYPLVTSRCIVNGQIDESLANHISKIDYEQINLRSNVQKYDVIMPMIGTVGNPALVESDGNFAIKNVGLFRTNGNRTLGRYIVYVLDSDVVKIQFVLEQRGGVQNFVSQEKLKNLYLPLHKNLEEIVDYLDSKCRYLDDVLAKKEQLISELESYKKSLIYEYVTGKREVPA